MKSKPRTLALILTFCGCLGYYSLSQNKPEISTNQVDEDTQTILNRLSDEYLRLSEQEIKRPTSNCFKNSIENCLEFLTPVEPKKFNNLKPSETLNSLLVINSYQMRVKAIALAKLKQQSKPKFGVSL